MPQRTRGALAARALAILAILALAAVILGMYRRLADEQDRLVAEARASGTLGRQPQLERDIRRELDPERSRLILAQALLSDELDRRWTGGLSPRARAEAAAAGLTRLERAAALAETVLRRRPAVWRSAMVLGAARYLRQARERDARPWAEPVPWEAPLRAAAAMAPAQPEPKRLLAIARLDTWFAQSADERAETRSLLRLGLGDPVTFRLLLDPWIRSASDPSDALALLPEDPSAYAAARDSYGSRSDWTGYLAAEAARRRLLAPALAARLERAQGSGAQGLGLRGELLRLVADTPVDLDFAPFVERILGQCPAGPNNPDVRPALKEWLRFALDTWQRGNPALGPVAIGRLTAAVGELPAPEAALAALGEGDLPEAERLERRSAGIWSEDWAPYLIAKAAQLASRDPESAAAALRRVAANAAHGARYWKTVVAVADARSDSATAARARQELAALQAMDWPATAWRYRAGRAVLEVSSASPAHGVELRLQDVPRRGSCLALSIDGRFVSAAAANRPTLAWLASIPAGEHVIEIVQLAGERTLPGRLTLTP